MFQAFMGTSSRKSENPGYMVKSRRYDYVKAVRLLNQTIQLHNKASDLKEHQKAARYFISNCYKAGIIYENR